MTKVAVLGGTGYLASIIKSYNTKKKNKFIFFSRKKNSKFYLNNILEKKNTKILSDLKIIIHLAGPNQLQLKKNVSLIKEKNYITEKICDLCLKNNLKLIYISSMQVYSNYGKVDIYNNSKIDLKKSYSKSHIESEKIINQKFINKKNMFTIIRLGNVFGFKKYKNIREVNNNLINGFCISALKKKKILIKDGSIQRTFVPSSIFFKLINFIIENNHFKNNIFNFSYKSFNLMQISMLIKKRIKTLYNLNIGVKIKKFNDKRIFFVKANKVFNIIPTNKKIYNEIDQILKEIKRSK